MSKQATVQAPQKSGAEGVDEAIEQLVENINATLDDETDRATSKDPVSGVIKGTGGHAVIVLRAGIYVLSSTLDIDTDDVALVGHGRVVFKFFGTGPAIRLSGEWVRLEGVQVENADDTTGSPVGTPAVDVTGDHCCVKSCRIVNESDVGIDVSGERCAVQACDFVYDAGVTSQFDIYYESGAKEGVVCCNRRSERDVLSYDGADNIVEAANSIAIHINVR